MSLADELLADFEEPVSDEELQSLLDTKTSKTTNIDDLNIIAPLHGSEELKNIILRIGKFSTVQQFTLSHDEYDLIVTANNVAQRLDNDIGAIHKRTRDIYNKRFPELESLVPSALDYMRTVRILGNDLSADGEGLGELLPAATVMIVSVSAATTQGKILEESDLEKVMNGCNAACDLHDAKMTILDYVQSRMAFVAPNLSRIVGPRVAAQLIAAAGGLAALSGIPACNLLVLGAERRSLAGFSTATSQLHNGVIYSCELVTQSPPDIRRRTARLVAGKATLAARVDGCRSSQTGAVGENLRAEILSRIGKMLEPPCVKRVKPLPPPLDQPRKKRGGRRLRRQKERFGMTELRKQSMRMNFGEIGDEAYQEDLGFSLGNIGKSGSKTGSIRMPVTDRKAEVKLSKSLQRKLARDQQYGGRSTVRQQMAGTASSVAFTPLEGLEIKNPLAAEKKSSEVDDKYFSMTSGFTSIKPKV